jgi:hypothetical protein
MFLPDVKSTIPKTDRPTAIIKTISNIDTKRGIRNLSSHLTKGYITKASKTAIVKGKITIDAIFNTAAIRTQHMKIMMKKMARPELKVLNLSFTPVLWHIFYKWTTKPDYF